MFRVPNLASLAEAERMQKLEKERAAAFKKIQLELEQKKANAIKEAKLEAVLANKKMEDKDFNTLELVLKGLESVHQPKRVELEKSFSKTKINNPRLYFVNLINRALLANDLIWLRRLTQEFGEYLHHVCKIKGSQDALGFAANYSHLNISKVDAIEDLYQAADSMFEDATLNTPPDADMMSVAAKTRIAISTYAASVGSQRYKQASAMGQSDKIVVRFFRKCLAEEVAELKNKQAAEFVQSSSVLLPDSKLELSPENESASVPAVKPVTTPKTGFLATLFSAKKTPAAATPSPSAPEEIVFTMLADL